MLLAEGAVNCLIVCFDKDNGPEARQIKRLELELVMTSEGRKDYMSSDFLCILSGMGWGEDQRTRPEVRSYPESKFRLGAGKKPNRINVRRKNA